MIPSKKLPKISIEKTLLLSSVLWGICLYLFGIHIKGPFIFGDEQVYFSFARTISKWNNINTYTQYGPLYPFFIAPFFFLKNIIQSYDFIKILNILFFISAVIPSYLLAKKLFKNSFLRIILPTLVLITPFGSFVYLVWAEPLYIPIFYWVCFLLYQHTRAASIKNSLLLGLLISFLYLTKPGAGFIAFCAIVMTLCFYVLCNLSQNKKNIPLAALTILTCFLINFIWMMHYLHLGVSIIGYPSATHDFHLKIEKIGYWRLSYDITRSIFYQFAYFFIGTWGLIGIFFTLFITQWHNLSNPEKNISLFILFYILGLMLLAAVGMSTYSGLDHKITQGRYYSLILPIIITLTLHFIFKFSVNKKFNIKPLLFILMITTLISIIASPLYTRNPLAHISMPELTPFIYISDKGLSIARAMVEKPSLPLRTYSILFFTSFVFLLLLMRRWKYIPLLAISIIFIGTLFNSITQQYYVLLIAKNQTDLNNIYRYLIKQHINIKDILFDKKMEFEVSFMTPFWMESIPYFKAPKGFLSSSPPAYFVTSEKLNFNPIYSSKAITIYNNVKKSKMT